MQNLNSIGLDNKKSEELAKKLNTLLANYSIFYQNVRGYHWNIKGQKFFELHVKFEELYLNLALKIDEVAERIVTFGQVADHRFSDYKNNSSIAESSQVSDGLEGVKDILASFKIIIPLQRELLTLADDTNDEGTVALMSDFIREQEKQVWMYSSYLNQ